MYYYIVGIFSDCFAFVLSWSCYYRSFAVFDCKDMVMFRSLTADSSFGHFSLTPDAVARHCLLERHLMLSATLDPSSLPVVVAQPNEGHANRTASVLK